MPYYKKSDSSAFIYFDFNSNRWIVGSELGVFHDNEYFSGNNLLIGPFTQEFDPYDILSVSFTPAE